MIETVDRLLARSEDAFFVTSYYQRSKQGEDNFKEMMLHQGFQMIEIPLHTFIPPEKLGDYDYVHLLVFHRKKT